MLHRILHILNFKRRCQIRKRTIASNACLQRTNIRVFTLRQKRGKLRIRWTNIWLPAAASTKRKKNAEEKNILKVHIDKTKCRSVTRMRKRPRIKVGKYIVGMCHSNSEWGDRWRKHSFLWLSVPHNLRPSPGIPNSLGAWKNQSWSWRRR